MLSHRRIFDLLIIASLGAMLMACGSVRTFDDSGMPSGGSRTPKDVWNSSNKHSREILDDKSTQHHSSVTYDDEQWKSLNIKLDKGDNRVLYREIKSWLGTPHCDGAHFKQKGTDCSGFVMEVFLTVYNMKIERNSARIFTNNCVRIDPEELKEGDLVFFHTGSGNGITHVGIYLKDNKFAHASSSRGVVIDDLSSKYYVKHFSAAGRVCR